ncbi:hypothetical protein A1O1_02006 [Capronia coronata CBS 617.96]|uniref:PIG-P domain-containing protein n=1 Tax=Capronia coronata CBS 617.96 TaxID=1182541 RepID=W9ZGI6_9EURO|nr:uncharacterized protein A1O1_02006 [Capronia coronata CBS 617.96]EXJ93614.1 hypothetical protein A1O1_02006 [Capronia coronata CBS 617.96]
MPPQSRGSSPEHANGQRPHAKSATFPPTLRPYLDNLPSPSVLIPDQRTPTGPRMIVPDRDAATPTPTLQRTARRRAATTGFELGAEDGDRTEDEGMHLSEPDEDASLGEDDFESHYSRQESEESDGEGSDEEEAASAEEIQGDRDTEEDEDKPPQNGNAAPGGGGYYPSSAARPDALSRVRSLPARTRRSTRRTNAQNQNHGVGLHTSQSTTSLPPPPPPPLYPPFYNRPPTPLPPSPSLTSLLRPPSLLNRSTASTRPTTPDSSDVETPNDTEAAVAHSARRAHPLPPTSPKVPTYEYYGFVLYLASSLAFLFYILWSYLPSPFLHALGITYYPNRWWSLAIPAWIVMLLVYIYVALLSYNVEYLTLPLDSLECMVDEAANVAILDESGRVRKGGSKKLVQELEERERYETEMEVARSKAGKARRSSKTGGVSYKPKEKTKTQSRRRSSHTKPADSVRAELQHVAGWEAQQSQSQSQSQTPFSHNQPSTHSYHGATFPYLSSADALLRNSQFGARGQAALYPNWELVWNEGTDAVMDIPIGGVCEVLYG